MRPTSRRAAASSFWRGYAASLRRSWLGRMVPARHGGRHAQDVRPVPVDQVHVHLAAETSGRRRFGAPARSNT